MKSWDTWFQQKQPKHNYHHWKCYSEGVTHFLYIRDMSHTVKNTPPNTHTHTTTFTIVCVCTEQNVLHCDKLCHPHTEDNNRWMGTNWFWKSLTLTQVTAEVPAVHPVLPLTFSLYNTLWIMVNKCCSTEQEEEKRGPSTPSSSVVSDVLLTSCALRCIPQQANSWISIDKTGGDFVSKLCKNVGKKYTNVTFLNVPEEWLTDFQQKIWVVSWWIQQTFTLIWQMFLSKGTYNKCKFI